MLHVIYLNSQSDERKSQFLVAASLLELKLISLILAVMELHNRAICSQYKGFKESCSR